MKCTMLQILLPACVKKQMVALVHNIHNVYKIELETILAEMMMTLKEMFQTQWAETGFQYSVYYLSVL